MKKSQLGCLNISGILTAVVALIAVIALTFIYGGVLFSPGGLNAIGGAAYLGGIYSHADLANRCGLCHPTPWGTRNMADLCLDCHTHLVQSTNDFHRMMIIQGKMTGCQNCHTEHNGAHGSLTRDVIKNFPHETTSFWLEAHKKNADGMPFVCNDCHTESLSKFNPTTCEDCHLKIDNAYLTGHIAAFGNSCTTCHDGVDRYGTAFDHSQTAYPLVGFHNALACGDCHTGARSVRDLQNTSQTCFDCHASNDTHKGQFGQNCAACHTPEGWGNARIDHDKTAFPLIGKHTTVVCESCHTNGVYTGTPKDCFYCHSQDDTHEGKLGQNCAACHTPESWQNVTVDHSLTAFPLVGQHANVVCENCHVNGVLKGTPKDCYSCHSKDDAHEGKFGQNCATCHTPESWKTIIIDHALTQFPLTGKHVDVACENCHVNEVFAGTPKTCFACHSQDDKHDGQFGQNCAACHNTSGWQDVNVDHSLTSFPLTGKHITVACDSCHINGVYAGTPSTCFACHSQDDEHNGQFGTSCGSCHTTMSWQGAIVDHSLTSFPLTGAHISVACENCHVNGVFAGTPQNCYACHNQDDQHNGQFGTSCDSCHSTTSWQGATIDHSLTAFPLTGAHVSVACTNCHVNGVFAGTPKDCYSCHSQNDEHNGQFGTSCDDCHSTTSWQGATIDHSLTAFPLTGAHVSVACTNCHVNGVFAGTPKDCYSCHSQDDQHNGKFGTSCDDCHSTTSWQGATIDHSLTAFPLTGAHVSVACTNCHVNGVFAGTPKDCYSCHSQDDQHNGKFGTSCDSCHSTTSWQGATIDHSLTAFPLTGAHVSVSCESCHIGGVYAGTPTNCYGCHSQDDAHNGQLGTSCDSCHSTTSWQGASIDHNLTAFPLTGAHVSVSCESCHVGGVYAGTPTNCYGCHSQDDAHNGQFGTSCDSCHSTTSWQGATIDHNLTAFPLTGAHVSVSCESCHVGGVFAGTPTDCYSCHSQDDAHNGQLGTSCGSCHSTTSWAGASIDHNLTAFPLTGAHVSVSCSQCHTTPNFQDAPTECIGCHAEPGYHMGLFSSSCDDCHSTVGWTPAEYNFPHTFPFDHGNGGNDCSDCHPASLGAYDCYSCHDYNEIAQKHIEEGIPEFSDCVSCHPTGQNP